MEPCWVVKLLSPALLEGLPWPRCAVHAMLPGHSKHAVAGDRALTRGAFALVA